MPRQLLKTYVKEAHRYKAVLVLRGLPNGSFKELTELVLDISDEHYPVGIQIDDLAFASFGVSSVPTIVLTNPASIFAQHTAQDKFDKVSGTITIKAALLMFANDGTLSASAKELLK
jgi:type-F conjugative transfer system pilin assembly protein TrbC